MQAQRCEDGTTSLTSHRTMVGTRAHLAPMWCPDLDLRPWCTDIDLLYKLVNGCIVLQQAVYTIWQPSMHDVHSPLRWYSTQRRLGVATSVTHRCCQAIGKTWPERNEIRFLLDCLMAFCQSSSMIDVHSPLRRAGVAIPAAHRCCQAIGPGPSEMRFASCMEQFCRIGTSLIRFTATNTILEMIACTWPLFNVSAPLPWTCSCRLTPPSWTCFHSLAREAHSALLLRAFACR